MSERLSAVILAAGLSSRMSGFKPLLPLGPETVLEREIRLFRQAGVEDVVVVAGRCADEVMAVAEAAGARPVLNPDFRGSMFGSVKAGIAALAPQAEALFVLPADIPLVRPTTLARLIEAHRETPERILFPTFRGERGHPPLLPGRLRGAVLAWPGEGGLAGCLADCLEGGKVQARDVVVADPHVLLDMDTDDDHAEILRCLARYDVPSRAECEELLGLMDNVNERGRVHVQAVARFAMTMASTLNRARRGSGLPELDLEMVQAAGLLHDIAKGLPDHEREGGRILDGLGFPRLAAIVAAHRDIDPAGVGALSERELVYLADKLAQGPQLVAIEVRFGAKLTLHGHDSEVAAAIRGRMARALAMRERYEQEIGKSLDEVLGSPRNPADLGGLEDLAGRVLHDG